MSSSKTPRPAAAQRREQIASAALAEFARHGYAAARVDDVARRAGLSKGAVYLYFDSKQQLFEAAVKGSILPGIERLEDLVADHPGSAEEILRTLFARWRAELINESTRNIMRLLVAESRRFPELADFYGSQVVDRGLRLLRSVVEKGVAAGDFRRTALSDYPQILAAPAVMSLLWTILFAARRPLDLDRLFETYLDVLFEGMRKPPSRGSSGRAATRRPSRE